MKIAISHSNNVNKIYVNLTVQDRNSHTSSVVSNHTSDLTKFTVDHNIHSKVHNLVASHDVNFANFWVQLIIAMSRINNKIARINN